MDAPAARVRRSPGPFLLLGAACRFITRTASTGKGGQDRELHIGLVTASVTEKQMNILRGTFHLKNCFLLSFEWLYVHLISNTESRDSFALKTLTGRSDILGTSIQWAEIVITSSVPVGAGAASGGLGGKALGDGGLPAPVNYCLLSELCPDKLHGPGRA